MQYLTSRLSPALLALTLAGVLILLSSIVLGTTGSHAASVLTRTDKAATSRAAAQPADNDVSAATVDEHADAAAATTAEAPAAAAIADESATGIVVQNVWARASMRSMNSAVYLVLHNNGSEADTLVGAASDVAEATEVHRSSMENGVMRMGPAGPIAIPAGESVELAPGGLHVMLIGLHDDLVEGTELTLTLQFEHAGEMTITAPVRPMNAMPARGH